jgi:hypothetical protein
VCPIVPACVAAVLHETPKIHGGGGRTDEKQGLKLCQTISRSGEGDDRRGIPELFRRFSRSPFGLECVRRCVKSLAEVSQRLARKSSLNPG